MQIEFSKIAKQTLHDQIEFLEKTWTKKEIINFLRDIKKVSENLRDNKLEMYQKYSKDIRSALIGKRHVRMFFKKESENKIIVLLFFDMRQDPRKIFDILK
jgi:plasmid stabilization system protein ParE